MVARGHACTTAATQGSSPRIRLADIAERAMQRRFGRGQQNWTTWLPFALLSWEPAWIFVHKLEELMERAALGMTTSNLLHARCDPRQAGAAVVKLAVDVTER